MQRRHSGNGWSLCSDPFTAGDIGHRTSGACISRSLASGKSAHWVSPASMTGRSSAAPPGIVGHLRGGLFALLIWRTAGTGSPPCFGNPQRGNRRRQGELGAGGGPEEFLRESQPRMGAPLRGAPRRRSAHDQPDPALVEGRHPGRRRGLSKRGGNPTRRFDQRHAGQRVPAYVLDLWFERVVKPRLRGEAHMIRYIDDFVMCFQYREDALRVQDALCKRLGKFGLTLEPTKTKLVEFGRFAQQHAAKHGRKRPQTIYFLGFTLYCTRNLKGNFRIGMRTEKSRLRRSLMVLQDLLRRIRHLSVREQVNALNAALRGHYAYYGIAGNFRSLQKVHRAAERYWHKMLCSRSWAGRITWDMFHQIKQRQPILRPKLYLPYRKLQALAVL